MLMHMFYVANEKGEEVHGELLGEMNDFTSFKAASKAARELSKRVPGRFFVSCCVPGEMYENGKNLGVL